MHLVSGPGLVEAVGQLSLAPETQRKYQVFCGLVCGAAACYDYSAQRRSDLVEKAAASRHESRALPGLAGSSTDRDAYKFRKFAEERHSQRHCCRSSSQTPPSLSHNLDLYLRR
jgi:hypothetical protein